MSSTLYRDIIMRYYRDKSRAAAPEEYTHREKGKNPLCGDDITLYVLLENGTVGRIGYDAKGCSISLAAAAMLGEAVEGKTLGEARELTDTYLNMLQESSDKNSIPEYPYLEAMQGVKQYPGRLPCARLAWETFREILGKADR
jgi:nitrogen fixation NifU-like protein